MNREKWEIIRADGKKNYILNYGLHGGVQGWMFWGAFMVIFSVVSIQLKLDASISFIALVITYPITSFLIGLFSWNRYEKRYSSS